MIKTHKVGGPCNECGAMDYSVNYSGGFREKLLERGICFSCNHWREWIERAERGDARIVRVGNVHYHIGDEKPDSPRHCRGFDGARWVVRFPDGRQVTSTNLWCQGNIPEHFQGRLPDNAEFVQEIPA